MKYSSVETDEFSLNSSVNRQKLSHLILKLKPDAHCMYAQDQDFTHTARILVNQIKSVS
jgi:hypothetical protein